MTEETIKEASEVAETSLEEMRLGKLALRFLQQQKTAHLFPVGESLPRINSCVKVIDDEERLIGHATISGKADIDVRSLTTREATALGYTSILAMMLDWAINNDNEAYMEWAGSNDVPATRISAGLRDFFDSRPKKNYKARFVELSFEPLQEERKSG